MPRPSRLAPAAVFAAVAAALAVGDLPRLPAQAKPAPAAVPPAYPTLTTPAALGVAPGKTADLVLTGTNLADATGVWTSFGGTATIPGGQKDAAKLAVKLDVPAGVPVGLHTLRVATRAGVSNVRPLVVDELPEVAEADKNKAKGTAQVIPVPCVVVGRAEPEAGDFFRFPVTAGQPVAVEVLGRRLGSPIDPVVLLYDGAGRELGGVYADDTPGLQTDARVVYTPKGSGELVVEVRDTTYRGGAEYAYRLRVGNFPGATAAFPLAVERGKTAAVGFAGPHAEGAKPVTVTAPADPAVPVVYAAPRRADGAGGWPVPVRVSDFPEAVEREPNNDAAAAHKLAVPGGVSARFAEKNDVDFFSFAGKKGQKLTIQALTFELNAPTEVYLRVLDAKGAELAKSDPQKAGVKLEFAPPADGEFFAACEHLNYLAGPSEVYHLSVVPAAPDFAVTLGLDRFDVPAGGVGVLPVTAVARANGFAGPLELSLAGADGLSGTLLVPPGANPTAAAPLFLPVTAVPGAKPGPRVGHVRAAGKVDGKDVVRVAAMVDGAKAALGGMPNPPAEVTVQVAAAVTPALPLALEVKLEKPEVAKGGTLKGTVTARRGSAFVGEIALAAVAAPGNVTAKLKPVAKGAASAEFELTAAANATPGVLLLRGVAKVGGRELAVIAPPVEVKVVEAAKKEAAAPKKDGKK